MHQHPLVVTKMLLHFGEDERCTKITEKEGHVSDKVMSNIYV